jgi:hypothetical protein
VVLSGQPEECHDKLAGKTSYWGNTIQKPPKFEAKLFSVLRKSGVRLIAGRVELDGSEEEWS